MENADGCVYGQITREKLVNTDSVVCDISDRLKAIEGKLNTGVLAIIVLAFFAGATFMETVVKMLVR